MFLAALVYSDLCASSWTRESFSTIFCFQVKQIGFLVAAIEPNEDFIGNKVLQHCSRQHIDQSHSVIAGMRRTRRIVICGFCLILGFVCLLEKPRRRERVWILIRKSCFWSCSISPIMATCGLCSQLDKRFSCKVNRAEGWWVSKMTVELFSGFPHPAILKIQCDDEIKSSSARQSVGKKKRISWIVLAIQLKNIYWHEYKYIFHFFTSLNFTNLILWLNKKPTI